MSEQFPIFRLATLLARQLSSPIATRIKEYAKGHPRFGRAVCMRGGRAAAAAELRFKLWYLQVRPGQHAGGAALPALSDQRALEAGADLLGEMILFGLGAAILTLEFYRQAKKQEAKVARPDRGPVGDPFTILAEQSSWLSLQLQVEELQVELRAQQRDIDHLVALLRVRTALLAPPPPAPPPPGAFIPSKPGSAANPAPVPPARPAPGMCPCPIPMEPSIEEIFTDPPLG